ncbi:hypothetical protein PVAP13_3KG460501 [Panicum virgatum]|uniref:Rab3GAP catalytic subunit conserved domain-containing protein n=1 Tax=Panicum virgatum TaxID=38727 RepID=A0A8T0V5U1_PANVG|nr:hypothetical protein PVAP13_3KG460501 [Panicum virgatum]
MNIWVGFSIRLTLLILQSVCAMIYSRTCFQVPMPCFCGRLHKQIKVQASPAQVHVIYIGSGCTGSFEAANPRCVLEDFVRWHSPLDWSEDCAANSTTVGEGSSRRGRLSDRCKQKGNLWEAAKPIPAVEQTPIYDEDLAVESIFDSLEVIEPSKLF